MFESDDYVEVCLIARNTQSTSCPVNAVIYYSVHTSGGNAGKVAVPFIISNSNSSPPLSVQREDYTPLGSPYAKGEGEMHWSMCDRQSCFRIDIIDNYPEVEDVEYFNFSLSLENDAARHVELADPRGAIFILPRRMCQISLSYVPSLLHSLSYMYFLSHCWSGCIFHYCL